MDPRAGCAGSWGGWGAWVCVVCASPRARRRLDGAGVGRGSAVFIGQALAWVWEWFDIRALDTPGFATLTPGLLNVGREAASRLEYADA